MYRFLAFSFGLSANLAFSAQALDMPSGAELTHERVEVANLQPFPTAAFAGAQTQMLRAEGSVVHRAFRLPEDGRSTVQTVQIFRDQYLADGFDILFECSARACGGFDFRYLLDLIPEPHMHVDLGDYQYLLAEHRDGRTAAVVVSLAPRHGFVHISSVTPTQDTALPELIAAPDTPANNDAAFSTPPQTDTLKALLQFGHVALDDLEFASGSSALAQAEAPSLADIARYLADHPAARLALVGHTDAEGSLEGNTALSKKRAEAVRRALIDVYGVSRSQLAAHGIGFLAPRSANATAEGRAKNRRVEAVLTSTLVE